MPTIVRAEGLGKRYELGEHTPGYGRLTESLSNALRRSRGREEVERREVWALRGASFEVEPAEVVGVVGRNGAGKSTLLKLLGRVTAPTEGRAEIRGRVGSLLEVGTGFHQELTGRENVFLSGAILGMRRAEIQRKFDEIVAFAEVEDFLDTQVKRYSSGMALRLGFAVAAFLEPEVLLVDEVLAVGDRKFREKCLGRIREVTRDDGRTVFFVSHDLNSVRSVCSRALLVHAGRIEMDGPVSEVTDAYEGSAYALGSGGGMFARDPARHPTGEPVFLSAELLRDGARATSFAYGDPLELTIVTSPSVRAPNFSIDWRIVDAQRNPVAQGSSVLMQARYFAPGDAVRLVLHELPLAAGTYGIDLTARLRDVVDFDYWFGEIGFEVVEADPFGIGSSFHAREREGAVILRHSWEPVAAAPTAGPAG
jgi:lipopolysaccharide transport system ATP-binding protein